MDLPSLSQLIAARQLLAGDHAAYTRHVSPAGHALSLEAGALVWCLLGSRRPASVADLGSGFSSVVCRRFMAGMPSTRVTSVDDDVKWLDRSRAWCGSLGLSTEQFLLWPQLLSSPARFDLLVYDLGRMPVRDSQLPVALDMVAPGGLVLLDDMHKFNYGLRVQRELAARAWPAVDLRSLTQDAHDGRYSWLAARPL